MQAVAQLLRYVYWVCPELQFREFRENMRKQLPESEEAVRTIAEMLIDQGREEGRTQGRVELLEQMVLEKFGSLPPGFHERLTKATDEQLAHFGRRVVRAETLEALLDD